MEEGLILYREAALSSPATKRQNAVKEVIIVEQMARLIRNNCSILEFEDLRIKLYIEKESGKQVEILDKINNILQDEISRTELTLLLSQGIQGWVSSLNRLCIYSLLN